MERVVQTENGIGIVKKLVHREFAGICSAEK